MKVRNLPGSGKDIAEDKGVHREVESEGSRMSGKVLTRRVNLWPDEQESSSRLQARVRLPNKSKPNNYTESLEVKMAGGWRKRNVWYPGRSVRNALKGAITVQGNEAVLNAQKSAEVIVGMSLKK